MPTTTDEFVIRGLTLDGKAFRPSDWAERLCGVMAQFGATSHMAYSPYVYPVVSDGVRCVVVDVRLRTIEPLAYKFLVNFAKDNELQTRAGRETAREPGLANRAGVHEAGSSVESVEAALAMR